MQQKNGYNLTKNDVQLLIDQLKMIDKENCISSYTYIKNFLFGLNIQVPPVVLEKGHHVMRGRVHKPDDPKFFKTVSDISYRPDVHNIKNFGRANEPLQSMFYCADEQVTALSETLTTAREDRDIDSEDVTWSLWEFTKDVDLVYIIGDPAKLSPNQKVIEFTRTFLEKLKGDQHYDTTIMFHKFISDAFRRRAIGNPAIYKITAAFSNYILNHIFNDSKTKENKTSTGIIYGSSIHPDKGVNIALKPHIVDTALKPIAVYKSQMNRISKTNKYKEENQLAGKIKGNELCWEI